MAPLDDKRYTRDVTRRLAAFPNVWWALANEYDLMWGKSLEDWEQIADIVRSNDPYRHLISIHNCLEFYDNSRSWITHCSMQQTDVYRTSENVTEWREKWNKPVVVDECAYEGDIDQGWGNITGQELTRRAWEGALRGGYVGHGETYLNDREELWWSKGGELIGTSPARLAFLAQIISEAPEQGVDPLSGDWDAPWGGNDDRYRVVDFGFNQPRMRTIHAPAGRKYAVDVIDTWAMTVDRLPGKYGDIFTVSLPGRQYMAIRMIAIEE